MIIIDSCKILVEDVAIDNIDYSKLEPNKLYIYPDPERYGNTSGLSKSFNNEYPLIHICEYTKSVKNASWPAVEGDIESNPHNQDFYAYFSKNQLNNNNIKNRQFLIFNQKSNIKYLQSKII